MIGRLGILLLDHGALVIAMHVGLGEQQQLLLFLLTAAVVHRMRSDWSKTSRIVLLLFVLIHVVFVTPVTSNPIANDNLSILGILQGSPNVITVAGGRHMILLLLAFLVWGRTTVGRWHSRKVIIILSLRVGMLLG